MVNFEKEAKIQIWMLVAPIAVSLLAAFVLPNYIGSAPRVRKKAAEAQIAMLSRDLEAYKMDVGEYPTTEQGLQALRIKPEGAARWDGPYLHKDVPPDPWNHPYIYKFPGKIPGKPEIISYGADGKPGGEGENADIVSE
jgi:general secretion pathway protein G